MHTGLYCLVVGAYRQGMAQQFQIYYWIVSVCIGSYQIILDHSVHTGLYCIVVGANSKVWHSSFNFIIGSYLIRLVW